VINSLFIRKNYHQLKYFILVFSSLIGLKIQAQNLPLFDNKSRIALVKKGGDYIYNMQPDSASIIIAKVKKMMPDHHPIVPMMEALNIGWQEMPLRSSSKVFDAHIAALNRVIEASGKLQEQQEGHPEGIFFELVARGLKAEYYAREGSYMKALGEARKMYTLSKRGFELADKYSEFLFPIGLYNYFREKYPERHPIFKPFLWVFKSGNIEKGLAQLDSATQVGILTKIEAHLYISYIYLRYEDDTSKAKKYLRNLVEEYPNNSYFKSKLIEYYAIKHDFVKTLPLIKNLRKKKDNYYKMCAEVFYGLYLEKEKNDIQNALIYYKKSLKTGKQYTHKALYFKSLAYIGLGRIIAIQGNITLAQEFFEKAIEIDESDVVTAEAKKALKNLKN